MTDHSVSLHLVTKTEKGWQTAFNLLSTFSMGIVDVVEISQISVSSVEMNLEDEDSSGEIEEFHDDGTMEKVYEAICKGLLPGNSNLPNEEVATDIVTALQNAGILFREIRK